MEKCKLFEGSFQFQFNSNTEALQIGQKVTVFFVVERLSELSVLSVDL